MSHIGLSSVPGYTYSALKCGIRYKDRLDYALIVSEKPCYAAGVFTTNKVFAAPVQICRERINNPVHGILVNATNANACTGDKGYENAITLTNDIARLLDKETESILNASTGIIGHQLPVDKMLATHDNLVNTLSKENGVLISEAIMTTDRIPKETGREFLTSIGTFTVAGTAKGAGMIAPNMATLLSFLVTDAPISYDDLNSIFKECINRTYNIITIDGDMSTNDTAILLSPQSSEPLTDIADLNSFKKALFEVLDELAQTMVLDGEGANHLITVSVKEALNDDDARKIAKSVAESLLVKTAIFGRDPNWGRIACASGYSGADISIDTLSIYINDIPLLNNGTPVDVNDEKLADILKQTRYTIYVQCGKGKGTAQMYTSDLSYDYVKINAEYST